jgi:hypothetical protein
MMEYALNQWGVQQHRQSTNQLAHHLSCAHFLSIKSFVITSKGRGKERKINTTSLRAKEDRVSYLPSPPKTTP